MTNIGPINSNSAGIIGGAYGFGAKPKTDENNETASEKGAVNSEQKQVSADQVLSFMAQSAVSVAPKTIDTTKYVDSESEKRIAGFMSDFEDKVADGLAAFDKEFSGINISDSAKMSAVLAKLNREA